MNPILNCWDQVERYVPWLLLLLGVDCFCGILLWLSDFSAFQAFLTNPDLCSEERLLCLISSEEGKSIRLLGTVLRSQKLENSEMADALRDYEEYIEGWAHEAKTPLSLLTMLLDNRGEELDPSMREKLEYICTSLKEDITQMLYYVRLKSSTKDYRLEEIAIKECLEEVLEDYASLLEEKQFVVTNYIEKETVYTDRRGLQFMLGQILSNSVKYSRLKPELTISFQYGTGEDLQLSLEADSVWGEGFQMKIIFKK